MLLLHDGSEVLLREAGPSDVPLVDALHARCSPASRRARFLSPTPRLDPDQLRALVDPAGGRSVLALTRDGGSAVGLADLRLVAPAVEPTAATPSATFGVLVEDTWQHRGLGTALVRRVAETAVELGMGELTGTVPAGRGADHPAAAPGRPAPDGGARRRDPAAERAAGDARRDGLMGSAGPR